MIFQIDSILMYIYILLRVIEIVMRFNIYINFRTYLWMYPVRINFQVFFGSYKYIYNYEQRKSPELPRIQWNNVILINVALIKGRNETRQDRMGTHNHIHEHENVHELD